MKKRYISLWCVALAAIVCTLELQAEEKSLHIQLHTGEFRDIALKALQKVTFSTEDVLLVYTDKTTEKIGIMTIKEFSFSTLTGVSNAFSDVKPLLLYPNPATDHIVLGNIAAGAGTIEIYSVAGGHILSVPSQEPAQTIDVSALSKGLYVLKLDDQVLKFTKL